MDSINFTNFRHCTINVDLLISLVEEKPCLWNMRNRAYNNRTIVNKEWEKVARALEVSKEIAKNKWKSLRDCYRLQLKKVPNLQSGAEVTPFEIKWPYFESMSFLSSVMQTRQTSGNLNCTEDGHNICSDNTTKGNLEDEQTDDCEDKTLLSFGKEMMTQRNSYPTSQFMCSAKSSTKPRKRKSKDSQKEELLKLKSRKLQFYQNDDSDLYFFKSLIPYMNHLTPVRKLVVRNEMLNILIQELSTEESEVVVFENNQEHNNLRISNPSSYRSTTSADSNHSDV